MKKKLPYINLILTICLLIIFYQMYTMNMASIVIHGEKKQEDGSELCKYGRMQPHFNITNIFWNESKLNCEHISDRHYEPNISSKTLSEPLHPPETLNFSGIIRGGHWYPKQCTPKHPFTLVVVAIRRRQNHLSIYLSHIHKVLRGQQLPYSLLIVNQLGREPFNRGLMFNMGFLAYKHAGYRCFVFADVDMIPESFLNTYTCNSRVPKHISVAVSSFNYSLPYESNFGGVVAFTKEQFQKVNGYSSLYWGWGGEDDDMYKRVLRFYGKVDRPSAAIGRIFHFPHSRNDSAPANPIRFKVLKAKQNYAMNGLNDALKYCTCLYEEEFNVFTRLNVKCRNVSSEEVLSRISRV